MNPRLWSDKTRWGRKPALILSVLAALLLSGCSYQEPPLSPAVQTFKKEVRRIMLEMQRSLTGPTAKGKIQAIDDVLSGIAGKTPDICVDCRYKSAVLNKNGVLLTTFPKNEFVGRNFSSYKLIQDALQKKHISQGQAYLADGTKMYFISAPLIQDDQVVGVTAMGLSPTDLEKWHLSEKEFLAIDFNVP